MGIALNLVQKDQSVFLGVETVAGNGTQLNVKIIGAFYVGKNSQAFLVFLEIDFNVVLE